MESSIISVDTESLDMSEKLDLLTNLFLKCNRGEQSELLRYANVKGRSKIHFHLGSININWYFINETERLTALNQAKSMLREDMKYLIDNYGINIFINRFLHYHSILELTNYEKVINIPKLQMNISIKLSSLSSKETVETEDIDI